MEEDLETGFLGLPSAGHRLVLVATSSNLTTKQKQSVDSTAAVLLIEGRRVIAGRGPQLGVQDKYPFPHLHPPLLRSIVSSPPSCCYTLRWTGDKDA
jgi:hypothetical protein